MSKDSKTVKLQQAFTTILLILDALDLHHQFCPKQ
jgi:hypothetical protein